MHLLEWSVLESSGNWKDWPADLDLVLSTVKTSCVLAAEVLMSISQRCECVSVMVCCTYSLLLDSHLPLQQLWHVAHCQDHMVHPSLRVSQVHARTHTHTRTHTHIHTHTKKKHERKKVSTSVKASCVMDLKWFHCLPLVVQTVQLCWTGDQLRSRLVNPAHSAPWPVPPPGATGWVCCRSPQAVWGRSGWAVAAGSHTPQPGSKPSSFCR